MIGERINQYKITEKLGAGGMGEVYLAVDTKLDRQVALKFLPERFSADPEFKSRFEHEAKATAALNHPNIVTVFDLGEHDGKLFIAMEHIDGSSLEDVLSSQPLSLSKVLDIALQCGEGLSAAHQAGIVHRDVKPANILIGSKGRVRILDFGLAKSHRATTETKVGSTIGTVQYESPEQSRGEDVDQRSDIFSFGVVLYEMITGRLPFGGDYEAAIRYAIAHEPAEPLARYKAGTPDDLQRIVDKALAKDPSERYQTMADLIVDLRRVKRDSQPVDRAPIPQPPPAKGKALAIVAGLAGVVVIAGYFILQSLEPMSTDVGTVRGGRMMLAVLPFENLGAPDDEYFADGITEEITARLAGVREIGVIARTSVLQYKGTTKTIGEIGAELGVDYILEGTVRWQKSSAGADRVRVTPQLIKVSDGTHAWADVYDENLQEVFAVQTDIATNITEALGIALREPERAALTDEPTQNVEAYDYFLRGNEYYNSAEGGIGAREMNLAYSMYKKAIDLDPQYIAAIAGMARAKIEIYWHTTLDSADIGEAYALIQRCLSIDSNSIPGRVALASYHYHDHKNAEARVELERVIAVQPNNVDALMEYIYLLERLGEYKRSVSELERVLELDPHSSLALLNLAQVQTALHDFAEAERNARRSMEIEPSSSQTYVALADILLARDGDLKGAMSVLDGCLGFIDRDRYFNFSYVMYAISNRELDKAYDAAPNVGIRAEVSLLRGDTALAELQFDSAYDTLTKVIAQPSGADWAFNLVHVLAAQGRCVDAISLGRQAIDTLGNYQQLPQFQTALLRAFVACGELDSAIVVLEEMLATPSVHTPASVRAIPDFDPLRGHPNYEELLAKYEGHTF